MFKVGDKAKGFKFDGIVDYPFVGWDDEMDHVVGVVGEVSYVGDSTYSVSFEGIPGCWAYPTDLWYLGKVEETTSFNLGEDVSFKVGDKVKFKKSSIDSGMIDATEDDVFIIENFQDSAKTMVLLEGQYFAIYNADHLEHAKEETMNNTEEQEIKWEVGQEVWCLIHGKGVVSTVYDRDSRTVGCFPVVVYFEDGKFFDYSYEGKCSICTLKSFVGKRTLFFSEPKIEAEKFPPKKPFVPKLKKGDVILVKSSGFKEGVVRTVHEELEDKIVIDARGDFHAKSQIHSIHRIGEEIIFN